MNRRTLIGALAAMPVVRVGAVEGDATRALQSAMDSAVSSGLPLVLDPTTYRTRTLNVPNGLVMVAATPGGYGVPIGAHAKIVLMEGTNDHLLRGAPGVAHVRIDGVHFDGNKNNNERGDIIHLDDAKTPEEAQWHIRDCFIEAGATNGIYVGNGRRAVQISDTTLNYNRACGARLNGSDAHLDRCILGSNQATGVGVGGTVCNIGECDIYGNRTGITVYSTLTKVMIRGNRIDRNADHGVYVSERCGDVLISENIFHSNAANITDRSLNPTVVKVNNIYGAE